MQVGLSLKLPYVAKGQVCQREALRLQNSPQEMRSLHTEPKGLGPGPCLFLGSLSPAFIAPYEFLCPRLPLASEEGILTAASGAFLGSLISEAPVCAHSSQAAWLSSWGALYCHLVSSLGCQPFGGDD